MMPSYVHWLRERVGHAKIILTGAAGLIRDAQGRVIAFGGRVLDNRLPKYINSPESPLYSKARAVYGVYESRQAIAKADRAIVVEGYIDAIALWQAGFKETVASLGTALTVEQLRLLSRYSRNLIACFDGDEAGRLIATGRRRRPARNTTDRPPNPRRFAPRILPPQTR